MTIEEKLGTIDKVGLGEIWPNEATDFTPWLEQNISALGDALDLNLDVLEREAQVGAYRLDLRARDDRGREVVIENQLGTTDHNHLGQLLTYMAGFDANVIVWIAKEFRGEHAEALNLLNRRTDEDTEFFGIEVELWSIDESRPAIHFNLVAVPNGWRKQNVGVKSGGMSERQKRYQDFFQRLVDTMREKHRFTNASKGQPQNWYSFSTGYAPLVKYGANFAARGRARVELYIDSRDKDWNKRLFNHLEEQRADIESQVGESLDWERLDHRQASRIAVVRQGSIDDDQDTLKEIQDWMVERLLKFRDVFGPRLDEFAV